MNKLNIGLDFQKVVQGSIQSPELQQVKPSGQTSTIDFRTVVAKVEKMFAENTKLDKNFDSQIKSVGPKLQNLFELQRTAHKLNFSTEIVSKSTEALSSSFRRIQQMS